jgi:hypothetical protein
MAMTRAQKFWRRVARGAAESNFVNTLNVVNTVTIDFVWYPGGNNVTTAGSLIDTFIVDHPATGNRRNVYYTWTLDGATPVRRIMNSGTITISLPKGQKGVLEVFRTQWEIRRAGAGVFMTAVNQLRGVQQRLNRLGYHLRQPGAESPGVDNSYGRRTEHAILQFQNDYRPTGVGSRLNIRGEWTSNTDPKYTGNLTTYGRGGASPNPSSADGPALQTAIRTLVGG